MKLIIFTDLDGSLLNYSDYSFNDAKPALSRIIMNNIPLIFTSSKTRIEIEFLQRSIGIKEPFIAENGGGIFFPSGYKGMQIDKSIEKDNYHLIGSGKPYKEIRRFVENIKEEFDIKGFNDMNLQELSKLTNLSKAAAGRALKREFSEPFIIGDPGRLNKLKEAALKNGIRIEEGLRFFHFIGINQDKGKAVREVIKIFKNNYNDNIFSIGIGDGKNDIPMFQAVDRPVLIPHADGKHEDIKLKNIVKARFSGSKGWNASIGELLDKEMANINIINKFYS